MMMDANWRRLFDRASPDHRMEMLRYAASTEEQGEATKLYIRELTERLYKMITDRGWERDRTEWGR